MHHPSARCACLLLVVAAARLLSAQATDTATIRLTVRVTSAGQPVVGAVVRTSEGASARTGEGGTARVRAGAGPLVVHAARLGYAPDSARVVVAPGRDTLVALVLRDIAEGLSGVLVTSGGGTRRLEDEALRVEALAGEDVAEKTEMRPADLKGFLSEMGGVRVQQTSAATGAAGVRLQGLRPRYTLMLADGLPVGTAGSGLDLLVLPPADLRQVEVIKGPATALYGPAAMGGTINLISKRPGHGAPAHERSWFASGSSQGGTNAYGWLSEQFDERWGGTLLVGGHDQPLRDMDGDGWADLPRFRRLEVRPRVFFDGRDGASWLATVGVTAEDRTGGAMPGTTRPGVGGYREGIDTRRADLGVRGHLLLEGDTVLQVRAAATRDAQARTFGDARERPVRTTSLGEVSLARTVEGGLGAHDLVAGLALATDALALDAGPAAAYGFTTASAFAQDGWRPGGPLSWTVSGRLDRHSRYGVLASPRVSGLWRVGDGVALRASAAAGRSTPLPFVEEAQAVGLSRLTGLAQLRPETNRYGSMDLSVRRGDVEVNATGWVSDLRDAVRVAGGRADGTLPLVNVPGATRTAGLELFAVAHTEEFFVTALYTLVRATEPDGPTGDARRDVPYQPRQTGGLDLTWEDEASGWWIALEGFYSGPMPTEGDPYRSRSAPYTMVGALVAKDLGPWRVFASLENLTDVRQTRFGPVVLPARAPDGRWTTNLWAPLEGRVVSLGLRWKPGARP